MEYCALSNQKSECMHEDISVGSTPICPDTAWIQVLQLKSSLSINVKLKGNRKYNEKPDGYLLGIVQAKSMSTKTRVTTKYICCCAIESPLQTPHHVAVPLSNMFMNASL